jgi:hypothetical protein
MFRAPGANRTASAHPRWHRTDFKHLF